MTCSEVIASTWCWLWSLIVPRRVACRGWRWWLKMDLECGAAQGPPSKEAKPKPPRKPGPKK